MSVSKNMWPSISGVYKRVVARTSKRTRTEIIIFVCGFVIGTAYALYVLVTHGPDGFLAFSDARFFYFRSAVNLALHHAFSLAPTAPFYPNAYHTPLYPLFAAAFFYLGLPLVAVILVQNVLAGLAGVLVYRIGLKMSNSHPISLVAALITVLEPMSLYWRNLLMSDFLFSFLIIAATYLLVERRYYWCAFFMGLATLTRPIGLYFFVIFLGMIVYHMWREQITTRPHAQLDRHPPDSTLPYVPVKHISVVSIIIVAIFILTVLPWYIRNTIVFNVWQFSSAGGYELYTVTLPAFAEAVPGIQIPPRPIDTATPQYEFSRFDFAYVPFYMKSFLDAVKAHPLAYAVFHIERAAYSLVSDRYEYMADAEIFPAHSTRPAVLHVMVTIALWLAWLVWLIAYALAFLSLADCRFRFWAVFSILLVGVNVLLSGVINPDGYSMSRYTMPFIPLVIISAGIGVQIILKMSRFARQTRH